MSFFLPAPPSRASPWGTGSPQPRQKIQPPIGNSTESIQKKKYPAIRGISCIWYRQSANRRCFVSAKVSRLFFLWRSSFLSGEIGPDLVWQHLSVGFLLCWFPSIAVPEPCILSADAPFCILSLSLPRSLSLSLSLSPLSHLSPLSSRFSYGIQSRTLDAYVFRQTRKDCFAPRSFSFSWAGLLAMAKIVEFGLIHSDEYKFWKYVEPHFITAHQFVKVHLYGAASTFPNI